LYSEISIILFISEEIICDQSISILSKATGIRRIDPDGQDCLSRFTYFYLFFIFNNNFFYRNHFYNLLILNF